MGYEMAAERDVDAEIARTLVCCRAIVEHGVHIDRIVRNLARDAGVGDVDHSTDRRGGIEQRPGTVEHLDALCGQWVDRDGVIRIGRRKVEAADSVDEDRRALTLLAAKDGARGARTEAGR